MNNPARITFKPGEPPKVFVFHEECPVRHREEISPSKTSYRVYRWRYLASENLAGETAIDMDTLCNNRGVPVEQPPPFNHVEITPCHWCDIDKSEGTGEGNLMYMAAGCNLAGGKRGVPLEAYELINFRAEFHSGDQCRTIFLTECVPSPLTSEEQRRLPGYAAILSQEREVETAKRKRVAEENALETTKAHNRKEVARLARERAKQPVSRQQVREALKVKTDKGVWKICRRHGVDKIPERQGGLDKLVQLHERHKKMVGEAVGKRNKARAQERRKGRGEDF